MTIKKAPDLPSEVEERQVICRLLQAMDIDILDYSITKEQSFDDPSLILTHRESRWKLPFCFFQRRIHRHQKAAYPDPVSRKKPASGKSSISR